MRYFSMFSGIGGLELGISRATNDKWECIGFSEIDKYAIQIYQKHFPSHVNFGDATRIVPERLPDFDLVCGGFPCQAFSIAGKRGGFDDTRGTLFFDIARIVRVKRPHLLFLENVKGLLSHAGGRTFDTIIRTIDELGYDCQWQVLNSKNFGVPQNRERVFIIGHLRGTARPKVFPIGDSQQESDGTLGLQGVRQIAGSLRATDYKGTHNNIRQLNNPAHSNNRVYGADGLSPSSNTMQGGMRQPFVKITDDMKIRRLTPTECERLQGYPDGWTEGISDSQRYKCLGNSVTVNVIQKITHHLI